MFRSFTNGCVALVQRFLPEPFILSCLLTVFVIFFGMFATEQSLIQMIAHWGDGIWGLLSFAMQMALVLVTGSALANAPLIRKGLMKAAQLPRTSGQGIIAISIVSLLGAYINWGFGIVVSVLYAKEVAKHIKELDYRLAIASSYSGFLIWHAGLSASIPLTLASGGETLIKTTAGSLKEAIPITETLFSPYALVPIIVFFITMPLINRAMHPDANHTVTVDPNVFHEEAAAQETEVRTFAEKMENSIWITICIGLLGIIYMIHYFSTKGFNLTLDIVIFILLIAGLIFHRTPIQYIRAFSESTKSASGILLQFPFYAGIMGMMMGANSEGLSLGGAISNFFIQISNETTFPLFTFLSAGIVNIFVPSGGGQWAVQAPIMIPAGAELGVPAAKTAMAIAWGDAWTNLIQPFWALPALAIAGLGARDMMGFCVIHLLYAGAIIGLCLLFI
ncbi:short-chain fatty acid transporter [Bacillus cytotoxicus]|uniref:Short chain fatty acid transporter n=1 Tax=Bacillus cytotoxicus TaxID=580165 RepID=A0AAX2CI36_9BACI|nr:MULTISPECIES: short-chain fatty acid transporter [Bacillus cereus group]QTR81946.1 short-chain fatty acid transporter [Bacillus cytotoxicus]QTR85685.1 short-chain fatty acid transporter [Bacillus cytotoxicus]SCL94565.1 Short chain fatty acid transporter [Bacillus cytotoxicus]HDR4572776.1 short-chain fatty acid transporter [Bacillus cytotoxicus]HDR4588760.1 short-chain fatty acid transporter [Bacillus cytotoxicus]